MLYNERQYEAVMLLVSSVKPIFSKDGNCYCFLLGENLQDGIAGFGKTGWEAALNFYKEFNNESLKGGNND